MAKKRRQKIEKKDDYVFKAPELDKNEFIRNEIRTAKATVTAFVFGILMGLVSFGLRMAMGNFSIGAIIGLFALGGLPFIYNLIKIDLTDFEMKSWLGVGAVYVFTWLMITILISNPPISDLASPQVEDVEFEVYTEKVINNQTIVIWEPFEKEVGEAPSFLKNETFRIVATIWDNVEVEEESIRCEILSSTGDVDSTTIVKLDDDKYSFEYSFPATASSALTYEYRIFVKDPSGNEVEKKGKIAVE